MEGTHFADYRSQATVHQDQLVDLGSTVRIAITVAIAKEVEKFNVIEAAGTMGIDCIAMLVRTKAIIIAAAAEDITATATATTIVQITAKLVGLCSKALATISFKGLVVANFD